MPIDTDHKKRAAMTSLIPFYPAGSSLGSPISMSDKWESAWTYPIGQYDLTLALSDLLSILDDMNTGEVDFIFADFVAVSDSIELVIPSWLRKVRIGDDVYRIVIKRIR